MVLQPNLVSWYVLIPPFSVRNFKAIGYVFCSNFHTLKKEKKVTQPTFKGSYLRNAWCDLVEIWNVRWRCWPAFPALKLFSFVKVSQSYVCMKITLFFFLLITHGCGAPASWAARHTTMCLDLENNTHIHTCNACCFFTTPYTNCCTCYKSRSVAVLWPECIMK